MKRSITWIQKATGGQTVFVEDKDRMISSVSTDTRSLQQGALYVPLVGDRFNGHQFLSQAIEAGAVVALWNELEPIPEGFCDIPLIVVPDTLTALQQMAKKYREEIAIPVVGITGSNGKTTTKDLVAAVLGQVFRVHKTAGNLNNHIGVPLTLLSIPEETEIAIVEMGMNHVGEISLLSQLAMPQVAIVTNIGESHIAHFGSREGIADAKLEIIDGLSSNGTLIYDGDESLLAEKVRKIPQTQIRIGWKEKNDEMPLDIEMLGTKGFTFQSKQTHHRYHLSLLGRHNIVNACYAIAVGRFFHMSEEQIAQGLLHVGLTGMRLEMITAKNGMPIINDCYNASPTSMKAAIRLLQEMEPTKEKWALLGDIRELGDEWEESYHRELGAYVIEKGIHKLFTVGDRGKWIAEGAQEVRHDPSCEMIHFSSVEEAGKYIDKVGHPQALMLVKASRAMKLDQVIRSLVEGA
ncbi:UDP-N-acetylmuramoyl-tripeptide--D-alanyl-D-alanine ligase [Thermoactinomyces sp. DSM 45892]|uniref:UDP-N-acetylmuramoyl-tripeptide--D-alanyl-D- alanine ligase n=1 Tax=Thermoactinomyces sp. DSM 45892 TaxID=1882753 RepID=UPI00089C295E|nr:UDP-N-acetylmuramoyl-tripeptide--D-alanyl-D-alanine ligase [Thermoactinomyces sp. DSM 45892]SDY60735.1 UDP-N-acetylmuramoyl-tripeptide--D-alanyl-D-alanine ligase [Thermoactinomyces sp. DSM 45892]